MLKKGSIHYQFWYLGSSGLVNFGLVHPLDHNLIVDDIDIEDISSDDDEIPELE